MWIVRVCHALLCGAIAMALSEVGVLACHAQVATVPPDAEQVYNELNEYWVDGDFDALKSYVAHLEAEWPAYVPTLLARATYVYHQGDQSEELSEQLKNILKRVSQYPSFCPPNFREILAEEIRRHDRYTGLFARAGLSREERLKTKAPDKIKRPSWGFTEVFLLAPEVALSDSDVPPIDFSAEARIPPASLHLDRNEAEQILADHQAETAKRTHAILLLKGSRDKDTIPALITAVGDLDWRVATKAAGALQVFGRDAAPLICEALGNSSDASEIKLLIWALLRTECREDYVRTALSRSLKNPNPTILPYQREALQELFGKE